LLSISGPPASTFDSRHVEVVQKKLFNTDITTMGKYGKDEGRARFEKDLLGLDPSLKLRSCKCRGQRHGRCDNVVGTFRMTSNQILLISFTQFFQIISKKIIKH